MTRLEKRRRLATKAAIALWAKPWLTKRQLSRYTGFSLRFIDKFIRPFVSVYAPNPGFGTKLLFNREEIDEFIKSRRVGTDLEIKL